MMSGSEREGGREGKTILMSHLFSVKKRKEKKKKRRGWLEAVISCENALKHLTENVSFSDNICVMLHSFTFGICRNLWTCSRNIGHNPKRSAIS